MKRYHIYEVIPDSNRRATFESTIESVVKPLLTSFDNVEFVSDDADSSSDKLYRFRVNNMDETCFCIGWRSYYGERANTGFSTVRVRTDYKTYDGGVIGPNFSTVIAYDVLVFSRNNKLYGLAFTVPNGLPDSDRPIYMFYNVGDIPVGNRNGNLTVAPQVLDSQLRTFGDRIGSYTGAYNISGKAIVAPAFAFNLEGNILIQNEIDFLKYISNNSLLNFSSNEIVINGERYYQTPYYSNSVYPMYIKGGDE